MKLGQNYSSSYQKIKIAGNAYHVVRQGKIRHTASSFHEAYRYGIHHFNPEEFLVLTSKEVSNQVT